MEGQEEVNKEVDIDVRSKLNGQDRMEGCRDAGWRCSVEKGICDFGVIAHVPVRLGRGVLAETSPGLRS